MSKRVIDLLFSVVGMSLGAVIAIVATYLKDWISKPSIQATVTGVIKDGKKWDVKLSIKNEGGKSDTLMIADLICNESKSLSYARDFSISLYAFVSPVYVEAKSIKEVLLGFQWSLSNPPDSLILKFQRSKKIIIPISSHVVNKAIFGGENEIFGLYIEMANENEIKPQWFPRENT